MNIDQLEKNLNLLVHSIDRGTFIYKLLEAYNLPKASISRLQKGVLNLSKIQSIPLMDTPWDYAFFIDAEFKDPTSYQEAVAQMSREFGELKIFGEYRSRKG